MKRYHFGLISVLLLVALAISPVAGGSNDTWDQSYYLTHRDTLAGQKDMSRYNPPVTPVPIRTINATTARLYSNVTACGKDGCLVKKCPFPFIRCGRSLTVMVVYNVNATLPDQPGPVVSYSLTGGPLQDPVYVYRAGNPDIFFQFDSLSGIFL